MGLVNKLSPRWMSSWVFRHLFMAYLNSIEKKINRKKSEIKNENPVQDQDQDHDFTLDFNIRPTFHT